ncbi:hypothetical protein HERIO_2198 [Hepatospora eriocheir]|uniref:Uncharacterized protein n=1 Tax=Hepatospora eriocheir TaxID=1081669 RepID=A0A1X0Q7U5_9MICR|nr:hypothetical protein HERIO_2198 [Hepatospora eriocheir]
MIKHKVSINITKKIALIDGKECELVYPDECLRSNGNYKFESNSENFCLMKSKIEGRVKKVFVKNVELIDQLISIGENNFFIKNCSNVDL